MLLFVVWSLGSARVGGADHVRELQTKAWESGRATWGHWGTNPEKYATWANHSNRLIPVYTFGIELGSVNGRNSVYRNEKRLAELYGQTPAETHTPDATWFDQTDVLRLQMEAAEAARSPRSRIVCSKNEGSRSAS